MKRPKTLNQLLKENQNLRIKLQEAEDTLHAIREGAVDAIVVKGRKGEQVFTLTGEQQIYRQLVETMGEAGLTTTPEGKILFCNRQFSEMLQLPMEEIVGQDLEKFVKESDRKKMAALLIKSQVKPLRKRLVFLAANGTSVPAWVSANLLEYGDSVSICLVAMDQTELEASKEAMRQIGEQREKLRTQQEKLKRSNADLEKFAYVISHDLSEPLCEVASFVQLLDRRYSDKLDDRAKEFIKFAVDGAKRMDALLVGILNYSRVQTHGKAPIPVSVQTALGTALASLQKSISETQAVITSDELPTVNADDSQLTQLFQNLIANTIKFHSDKKPKIHIACQRQEKFWQFSVRDNGIGIDPKFNDRIFVIFQRLHTRDKYPGYGIGLSICKRIVERHGGRIWVESQLGQGSTFYFTIPD